MKIPNLSPATRNAARDLMERMTRSHWPIKSEDMIATHGKGTTAAAVALLNRWEALHTTRDPKTGRKRYRPAPGTTIDRKIAIMNMLADPEPADHTAHAKMIAKRKAREGKTLAEHRAEQRKTSQNARHLFGYLRDRSGKIRDIDAYALFKNTDEARAAIDRLFFLKLIEEKIRRRKNYNHITFYRIREPQTHSERIRYDNAMIGKID